MTARDTQLKQACRNFDYIRFTLSDLNGAARGKTVPARNIEKYIDGLQIYAGTFTFGPSNEIPMATLDADVISKGNISCNMIPDFSTLHEVPWSNASDKGKSWRIGQLLCETAWVDGPKQPTPRTVALNMLSKLDDLGFEALSGMECEFKLYKDATPDRREPVFKACDYCSPLCLSQFEDFICYIDSNLNKVGVNIGNFMCEYSPGQFEFAIEPEKGIKSADNSFLCKQGIKEMAMKRGLAASFMAKPDLEAGAFSGAHFNLSLWDKKTGKNVFCDESSEDKLSEVAKHFLGGLIKHSNAMTALCCPTVNCYRRLHQPWAPDVANWGMGNRSSMIRVKNSGEQGTFFENRLPSAIVNPYLAMVATVAAGLDGINNKMAPPKEMDVGATLLPTSLGEALDAFEKDTALIDIMGKEFVKYYIDSKREIDLAKLPEMDWKAEALEYDSLI